MDNDTRRQTTPLLRTLFRLNAGLCSLGAWTLWLLEGGHDRGFWMTPPGSVQRYRDAAAMWRRLADGPRAR